MRAIKLERDETRIFELFADGEPDPRRVRFWRVVISKDGLNMEPNHEPLTEAERCTATWHNLYDIMSVRLQLLEEIEAAKEEIAELQRLKIHERTHWRRLRQLCENRQAQLNAMPPVIDAEVADVMVLRLHKLGVA